MIAPEIKSQDAAKSTQRLLVFEGLLEQLARAAVRLFNERSFRGCP
jgi:hypothetical protein